MDTIHAREASMAKLNDDLDRTYQRIYRRLAVSLFVAYGIVLAIAVATLVDGAVTVEPNGLAAISAEHRAPPPLPDQNLHTARYD
jgi:hypothetical protein